MSNSQLGKQKQLADLTHELRTKTGVESVTPIEKKGLDGAINTVQALLNSGGTELKDLMARPRVTAAESNEKAQIKYAETRLLRSRGRVSCRMTRAIPKRVEHEVTRDE